MYMFPINHGTKYVGEINAKIMTCYRMYQIFMQRESIMDLHRSAKLEQTILNNSTGIRRETKAFKWEKIDTDECCTTSIRM